MLREKTLLKKTPKKVMAREPIKREPITFSRLTKEELKLEAALQREEVALGLRNANGSIPPSPAFPKIQSEERRLRLSAKTDRYGEQLANWLNASQRTPENHRVCKVIECFQATSASVTKAYWPTSVMVGGKCSPEGCRGRLHQEIVNTRNSYHDSGEESDHTPFSRASIIRSNGSGSVLGNQSAKECSEASFVLGSTTLFSGCTRRPQMANWTGCASAIAVAVNGSLPISSTDALSETIAKKSIGTRQSSRS